MTWIDVLYLGVLLLSGLVGLWRGLVQEGLSWLGWVLAATGAYFFSTPLLAPHLRWTGLSETSCKVLAFVIVFVLTLVVWSFLVRLLDHVLQAVGLGVLNRSLGCGFGLVRGALIVLLINTALAHTPWGRHEAVQKARGVALAQVLGDRLKPYLPSAVAAWLP